LTHYSDVALNELHESLLEDVVSKSDRSLVLLGRQLRELYRPVADAPVTNA